MTYFEYGYDLDAQQAKDNEQYENNRKVVRVIDDNNTPPLDVQKVQKVKGHKEQNIVSTPPPNVQKVPKGKMYKN